MATADRDRLSLYRRLARALNAFFAEWTASFCRSCLDTTRLYHRGDPRADVELISGTFPGCCHAGAGDAYPLRSGAAGGTVFPSALRAAIEAGRPPGNRSPAVYRVRERGNGRVAEGVPCIYFAASGCSLGAGKGPLCLSYLCPPVREALTEVCPREVHVDAETGLCGAEEALRAVAVESQAVAVAQIDAVERGLVHLRECLRAAHLEGGDDLYRRWVGRATAAEQSPWPTHE